MTGVQTCALPISAAELTTGEGSGIGLWIVDRIMSALGGRLDIQPTQPDGLTSVRLEFNPITNVPRKKIDSH